MAALRCGQRQEQGSLQIDYRQEAVVLVESCCLIVLGINYKGVGRYLGVCASCKSIGRQCSAEPLTAHDLIDGKPAHPNRWNRWVTWEPFCNGLRKVAKKNAGRSQRIESARAVLLVQCDITARHSTTYVLRYALPEIAVQRFAPTAKLPAIPCRIKRDNAKHQCLLRPLRSVCADAQKLA